MKDKKKLFIIIGAVLLLLALIITCVLLKKKSPKTEEIIITFNVDGGEITENIKLKNGKEDTTINADTETTIQNVKAKKGTEITLPKAIKDGFNFMGWYIGEDKQGDKVTLDKDTIITAKWEQIPEDAKTFTVTFNSNGGTSVDKLTVECDKELTLPANPKKEGYKFLSWVDQNERPIYDQALLTCEDITLYANWEKKEKLITYTCTEGDIDENHKCTDTMDIEYKCPDNTHEYNGKCVTINYNARKDYEKSCEKQHVTYMSFAGSVDGEVVNWGKWGCAYYKTNDTDKSTCESHGFKWVTPKNACYVKWVDSTKNSCDNLTNYVDINNPNQFNGVNGLNSGCYPITSKVEYCKEGYTKTGNKCKKILGDAIRKEEN